MTNYLSVTRCVYDAAKFVFAHFLDCIFHVIPILFLVSIVAWLQGWLGGWMILTGNLLQPFIYAMFAVAWHRYSVLQSERQKKWFNYRLGKREFKFGALSVIFTLGMTSLAAGIGKIFPLEIGLPLFLLLLVPILVTVIFIYPAIALDQPIQIRLFLNKGVKLILSFIIALVLLALIGTVLGLSAFFVLKLLSMIFTPAALKVIIFILTNLLIIPLLLAISTSSASFLYKRVIGLSPERDEESLQNLDPTA
ncbi:hypothetical protein [Sneathiella aquimaris]|uniref:hypothetical protein n=1 Tax=Sneathiella aquimaris TaxID=2599305 RepID=UPI00146A4DE0|nr:hypothetical protein [Sneathiella aquimaris]